MPSTDPSSCSASSSQAPEAPNLEKVAAAKAVSSARPESSSAVRVPRLPAKRKKSVLDDDFELSPVEVRSKRRKQEPLPTEQQQQQQQHRPQQYAAASSEKQQGHMKTSVEKEKQDTRSSAQQVRRTRAQQQQQQQKHPGNAECAGEVVDDSQPGSEDSETNSHTASSTRSLPGLKIRKQVPSINSSATVASQRSVQRGHGTSLEHDPASQSNTSILAPNSLTPSGTSVGVAAAAPTSRSADASVIVPSSLTPSGTGGVGTGNRGEGDPPSSEMMKEIFRNRGTKRKKNYFVDESSSGESDGGGNDSNVGVSGCVVKATKDAGKEKEEDLVDLWGSPLRASQQPGPGPSHFTKATAANAAAASRSPLSLKGSPAKRGVRSKAGEGFGRIRSKKNGKTVPSSLSYQESADGGEGGVRQLERGGGHHLDPTDTVSGNGSHGNIHGGHDDDVVCTGVTPSAGVADVSMSNTSHLAPVAKRRKLSSKNPEPSKPSDRNNRNSRANKLSHPKKRSPELRSATDSQTPPQISPEAAPAPSPFSDSSNRHSDIRTPRKQNIRPPKSSTTTTTPQKFSPPSIGTPFLSTRKRKVKKQEAADNDESAGVTDPTSAFSTQSGLGAIADSAVGRGLSQMIFTSFSLRSHKEDIPPTAVSTGGRRSKITAADSLWNQETRSEVVGGLLEGEDPLGEGEGQEEWPKKAYQPVLSVDGFIMAREAPKVKVRIVIVCTGDCRMFATV